MIKIKIDKYVAVPARKRRTPPNQTKYPWQHIEVGDSFFAPGARYISFDKRAGTNFQISTAPAQKKYPGTKWSMRAVTENGVVGVRVWRVK